MRKESEVKNEEGWTVKEENEERTEVRALVLEYCGAGKGVTRETADE